MVCFDCGERFKGDGVLCKGCKAKRLDRGKPIKPLKARSIITLLIDYFAVIVAVIMM